MKSSIIKEEVKTKIEYEIEFIEICAAISPSMPDLIMIKIKLEIFL